MKKNIILFYLLFFGLIINGYAQADNTVQNENTDIKNNLLIEQAKKFTNLLQEKKYDIAFHYFDSTMKAAFPVEKLQESWETIEKQVGKMQKIVQAHSSLYNQKDLIILTVKFESMYLDIRCIYGSEIYVDYSIIDARVAKADTIKLMAGFYIAPNYTYSEYKIPEYIDINTFEEQKITFGIKGWELTGILTIPKKDKKNQTQLFPVVVMVAGSGPNDMDESIGPNKPFKDIALGLASKGIATLRYNKRTKEHAEKMVNVIDSLTLWEEVIEDVLEAINKVAYMPDIDPQQIYVLGHSLGGMCIPRIAERDHSIAGFIVMAGNARPLHELLIEQYEYIFKTDGIVNEDEKKMLDTLKVQVARINDPKMSKDLPMSLMPLNTPAAYWLDIRDYHPADNAKIIKSKILILQGERDYQVTIKDFNIWKSSLSEKKNVEFKLYPKLNHLFIEGSGKSTPEEYAKEAHVAEYVIDDITKFVK